MREANRKGDQIRVERVSGVLAKKLCIRWKQAGIQDLQNPGKVNFRIFRVRVIAMNQKRNGGQNQQAYKILDFQKEFLHSRMKLRLRIYVLQWIPRTCQWSGESLAEYLPPEAVVNALTASWREHRTNLQAP
jgi:hypothetical protein